MYRDQDDRRWLWIYTGRAVGIVRRIGMLPAVMKLQILLQALLPPSSLLTMELKAEVCPLTEADEALGSEEMIELTADWVGF